MQKDSLLTGFVMGALVPVLGFVVIEFMFSLLTQYGLIEEVTASTSGRRMRTMLLFSLCCNLIPFQIAKKERYDNTLRGIVFPTLIYVLFWIYKFYGGLF